MLGKIKTRDNIEHNRINTKATVRLFGKPKKKLIPRRQIEPRHLESSYFTRINILLNPLIKTIQDLFKLELPGILQQGRKELHFDSSSDDINRIFNIIQITAIQQFTDSTVLGIISPMISRVDLFQQNQFDRQLKSVLGINPLLSEPDLNPLVDAFTAENVRLIKDIPNKMINDLEGIVRRGVVDGISTKELSQQIQDKMRSTKKRAKLIARDQINKFNGNLNKVRQKAIGVTHYVWSNSNDRRVRSRHLNGTGHGGKTFSWNKPPSDGHPGQPVLCRCQAIPLLEDLIK